MRAIHIICTQCMYCSMHKCAIVPTQHLKGPCLEILAAIFRDVMSNVQKCADFAYTGFEQLRKIEKLGARDAVSINSY